MVALGDIFRRYGPAYLESFGDSMPASHRKAVAVLQRCRTGELGYALYQCDGCGTLHVVPRSCGNRHCPGCQAHKTQRWLEKQRKLLLPCPYFLITFTVPEGLRRLIRSNQRVGYEAMFQAAVRALRKLAGDPKFLGASKLGLVAVLHTWGGALQYHPHIHMLVPAGGLAEDGWRPSRADYFVAVRALSVIYREKLRLGLKAAGLDKAVPSTVWDSDWVVHSKAVGDGEHCLEYLARYVFRVAISNSRILSCENGKVVFRYRESESRRWRTMTLEAMEFIRRFLQHVLPSGLMKVRHYGFLSPNARESNERLQALIVDYYSGLVEQLPEGPSGVYEGPVVTCPDCGEPMRLVRVTPAPPVPVHDSG